MTCGSRRFDHFAEAAAGTLWGGWGPAMADRDQIASAVSWAVDGGIIFALKPVMERVFATGKSVFGHFRMGGQVGQDGGAGLPIERPVKQGIGEWLAKLASRCAARISFFAEVGIGDAVDFWEYFGRAKCGVRRPAKLMQISHGRSKVMMGGNWGRAFKSQNWPSN